MENFQFEKFRPNISSKAKKFIKIKLLIILVFKNF